MVGRHAHPHAHPGKEPAIGCSGGTLVTGFSAHVRRGDVIGIIGPNGAGKSTLLRAITGAHAPARGEIRIGTAVELAYYRQDLAQVPAQQSLFDIKFMTCARSGIADRCRHTSAGSASAATRYSATQIRFPVVSARASRWQC